MKLVGQILKQNREIKKLTLLDISIELNISESILTNIENNQLQNDIDGVFILGHLRSYCFYLDLDHENLVKQFKKERSPQEIKKIEIDRPILEKNSLFSNKIFSFSLILIIIFSFYFLFIQVEKPSREYAIIPDLPENYVSIVEKSTMDSLIKKKNDEEKNIVKLENKFNSSSVIASLPNIEDKNSSIITLKFLDDTWVQLRDVSDKIIFSQLMNKNDEYSYELNTNYSITSGNAGHILVLINQKVRGKVGKKGQVVDSLIINKDFNN